jgi:dihydrofolate synthase/folylpolyglutamate synthase
VRRSYEETLDYLFSRLPVFQRVGAAAYKPGLDTIRALCALIGNPQEQFPCLHIAGTNGKGSSSHSLASVLQEAGYKTGLYTSPHLVDFRERIRVNGAMIPKEKIIDWTEAWEPLIEQFKPSFFEITVAMAFLHFAEEKVDIAVIEVGMGGRLDSTNIITPILSLITNIGLDHQKFLGDTLPAIAGEKAGIIKPHVPVVISEVLPETLPVFQQKALLGNAPLFLAQEEVETIDGGIVNGHRKIKARLKDWEIDLEMGLLGQYQIQNLRGILCCIRELNRKGYTISDEAVKNGIRNVAQNTGLMGRWQVLQQKPWVIADTAHNEDGIRQTMKQIQDQKAHQVWLVFGMVEDKDHKPVLDLLPKEARIYVTQPALERALPKEELYAKLEAMNFSLVGIGSVQEGIEYVLSAAGPDDLIYIGGSTFVVSEIPFEKFIGQA